VPGRLITLLSGYDFPGNIRELQGMVFDAMSRSPDGALSMDAFLSHIGDERGPNRQDGQGDGKSPGSGLRHYFEALDSLPTLGQAEEYLVELALERARGNQTLAAQMLGLTRSALNKRLVRGKTEGRKT